MAQNQVIGRLRKNARSTMFWIQAAVLLTAGIFPLLTAQASAGQLTSRSATINKSKVSSTGVQIIFGFTMPTTGSAVQGIVYQFCTTPLGTCVLPTGMAVQTATQVGQTGFPNNATAFAPRTGADLGACTTTSSSATMCFNRTEATTGGGAITHTIGTITAPSSKQSVYIRIGLYSDTSYATNTDSGTVAVAFVDQLLTNGRVQERLDFCVAAIDAAAALPTTLSTCSALGTSTIDIGVIDNSTIATSPVATTATNGSNNKYGILMSNTNAAGGEAISYFPEAASSGTNQLRNFRVAGSSCNATSSNLTDTCFYDAATTGTTFTAGSERFGIQIPCIDDSVGTTQSFRVANGATINSSYSNTDANTDSVAGCQNLSGGGSDAGVKFAWDNSGSAVTIASTNTVVDNEIVKVRFGATASSTTPTGAYTVTTNYIATPTF